MLYGCIGRLEATTDERCCKICEISFHYCASSALSISIVASFGQDLPSRTIDDAALPLLHPVRGLAFVVLHGDLDLIVSRIIPLLRKLLFPLLCDRINLLLAFRKTIYPDFNIGDALIAVRSYTGGDVPTEYRVTHVRNVDVHGLGTPAEL